MPYRKVNPQTCAILSDELTLPDAEVVGLSQADMDDLGVAFPDRPEFQGVAFWPESRITPTFDPMAAKLLDQWAPVADLATKTVVTTQQTALLNAAEIIAAKSTALQSLGIQLQSHLDAVARARGYADLVTCISYISSTNAAWKADATAATLWRDNMWANAIAGEASVLAGTAQMPTIDSLIAQVPTIVWPS